MPSAGSTRLTDDFWLAAHDGGFDGKRLIGDWPLGIGLATGLLAELVRNAWCELWDDRLFRTRLDEPQTPRDPALHAVYEQMKEDEKDWPPPPPRSRTYIGAHAQERAGLAWPLEPTRPPGPGHDVRQFMSWLVYDNRAEKLVGDRLARDGLVRRETHRRRFRGTTVRYVPCDTTVLGFPGSAITNAAHNNLELPWQGTVLAALFYATGLHEHALATLTQDEHAALLKQIKGLNEAWRVLLRAADAAVGDAAIRGDAAIH